MPKTRTRAQPSRRNAASRPPLERSASGKRQKFRTDPLSRFLRALDPRRPILVVAGLVAAASGVIFLFAAGYVHRGIDRVDQAISSIAADAGFGISAVRLSGTNYAPPGEVLNALGFKPGDSIFAADPQQARQNLQNLRWIAQADVSRRYPDLVFVHVVERAPFALWQSPQGLYAVDHSGSPIAPVKPGRFGNLPFFVGDAPDRASDLVGAIRRHRAVAARVRAMQRVEGRRWSLVLDDGVIVKLPEDNWQREIAALEHLIVDKGVLERDITEIDLRDHDHYIFVMRHAAPPRNSRGEPT
jgi:cell division protein FtsQ